MRSRYTAHVLHRWQHLWATWHPRTRPDVVDDAPMAWTGLTIVDVEQGQPGDEQGVVEYVAQHTAGTLHEKARFEYRAHRWLYTCLLYTSPSPRDKRQSRMPSSA